MEREALVKIIVNLVIVSLGITSLIFMPSAKSLAIAYAIGSGVGLLITITILRHYLKNLFSNFNKDLLWPILSSAWPFAIMGFSGAIMVNIDTVMIGWFRSASEVGYYSAAQRPIQLLYVIPNLLGSAVFPVMARFAAKDNDKFRQILEKSITIVLAIGIPIAIGGAILGKDMITVLFGSGYAPAATTFVILLFTLLLVLPNTLISGSLFAYNEQKNFLGFIIINALINTSLNYLLIPSYGMPGAAIATLIANFSASIFICNKMKKINYFSVISHLKIIALATLIMAVSASTFQYLHLNFFVNLFISATIYIGLLISFKEPVIKEILGIFQLQNKSENQII
jgi:O-antigen/teichoic acid export membrane protein